MLLRALLREISGMKGCLSLPRVSPSELFDIERGGKQGGVETPDEFNVMMEWLLEPLSRSWAQRHMGYTFAGGGPLLTHLLWADNVFILASSVCQFNTMVQELTDAVYAAHFRWKLSSLECMVCRPSDGEEVPAPILSTGTPVKFRIVGEMQVLGVLLNNTGDTKASQDHRFAQAEACFWRNAKIHKGSG